MDGVRKNNFMMLYGQRRVDVNNGFKNKIHHFRLWTWGEVLLCLKKKAKDEKKNVRELHSAASRRQLGGCKENATNTPIKGALIFSSDWILVKHLKGVIVCHVNFPNANKYADHFKMFPIKFANQFSYIDSFRTA